MKRPLFWAGVVALIGLILASLINTYSPFNPVFYARASFSVLIFFAGLVAALLVASILWRLTRERQHQQALRDTRQELAANRRSFVRRLDHEMKNPLTAIRTGLATAIDAPAAETDKEALAMVQAQALRLSRLTADLRKLAELETRPLEWAAIDVEALMTDVVEAASDLHQTAHRIDLSIPQAPWPLPAIQGDRDLLFLALYNLLDNARKYTPPDGRIELRARENGRFLTIEVADTGPGIPADEVDQVWKELYRGRSAAGTAGSGLGLPLVRAIVERHHGQADLHSRSGQGTLVSLSLPVNAPPTA